MHRCLKYGVILWFLIVQCCNALTIGLQGSSSVETVEATFKPTAEYLEHYLGQNVDVITYTKDAGLSAAFSAGSVDMVYSGATFFTCQQLVDNVQALLSLVQIVSGQPTSLTGGVILSKSSRNITTLSQVEGSRVSIGDVSQLTGCQAQWALLQTAGLNLFADTRAVFMAPSQNQIMMDVLTEQADIGFVSASVYAKALSQGQIPKGSLRVLNSHMSATYPLAVSTDVFPSTLVSINSQLSLNVTNALLDALLSIGPDSQPAVSGGYYGWTAVPSLLSVINLQESIRLYDLGIPSQRNGCKNLTDIYSSIICPFGYATSGDANESCSAAGIACPAGHMCVCSPCKAITYPWHVGKLSVAGFVGTVVGGLVLIMIILIYNWRRRKIKVHYIPYRQLEIDRHAVLGNARQGLVLKGSYMNMSVAIKRASPRYTKGWSLFDTDSVDSDEPPPSGPLNIHPACGKIRHALDVSLEHFVSCAGFVTVTKSKALAVTRAIKLQHPNLLKVYGVSSGNDGQEALVVYQHAACGTLFELLCNPSVIEIATGFAAAMARDVARGLLYLHTQSPPVIGKSIRSHHVFLGLDYSCMLGVSFNNQLESGRSRLFKAPEVLRGQRETPSSDVYSFGMLLFEILHRKDVFSGEDADVVVKGVRDRGVEEIKRPVIRSVVPEELQSLIMQCWAEEPHERPFLETVIPILDRYADTSVTKNLLLGKQQADQLLNKILPDYVVKALQEGRRPSERGYPMVTIYFSDITGFTSISSNQKPRQVMHMLDDLYTRFDKLCEIHGVMKLETAGDCYLCVGGLREPHEDHTARIARFALDANKEAKNVLVAGKADEYLSIRTGFHCGPVTAGVIGTDKPRFCLFGDPLNVASRMESTGEPDRIQMSAFAASLLRQQDQSMTFRIRRRAGDVQVKGKAPMQTCWLCTDADLAARPPRRRRGSEIRSDAGSSTSEFQI